MVLNVCCWKRPKSLAPAPPVAHHVSAEPGAGSVCHPAWDTVYLIDFRMHHARLQPRS